MPGEPSNPRYTDENLARMIGPGWFPIVQQLRDKANELGLTILQVKEKLGGLRFYYAPIHDEMDKAVKQATIVSFKTCEKCGQPGTLGPIGKGYWIKTYCDVCRKEKAT